MPQGLQIWDEDGVKVLDTDSRTVKILGVFGYDPNPVTYRNPLFLTETPFYIVTPYHRHDGDDPKRKVVFNGDTATIHNVYDYTITTIYVGVF